MPEQQYGGVTYKAPMEPPVMGVTDAENIPPAETVPGVSKEPLELTIVMPCLNEAKTVATCVSKAVAFLRSAGISGEVIVADNGSADGSARLAVQAGARVVSVSARGYGSALQAGIEAARGKFVIMGDADDSYDFSQLHGFVERLRAGDQLVMGNRFRGGIKAGAMPLTHRYFGNPLLTAIGRRFFGNTGCGDFYCGLRGFEREAILRLALQSRGMEFALEMLIKAGMHGLRTSEVPTTLSPDGRDRPPHLRTFKDGWRSLRLYLVFSPRWFFAVPGGVLLSLSFLVFAALVTGPKQIGAVTFDYHTLLYSGAGIAIGYQALLLSLLAKLVAVETGLHPPVTRLTFLERRASFEMSLIAGAVFVFIGLMLGVVAALRWREAGFGQLAPTTTIRLVASSILLIIVGGQTALTGCFLGLINLVWERRDAAAAQQRREETCARH
jgi:hypothetical protein